MSEFNLFVYGTLRGGGLPAGSQAGSRAADDGGGRTAAELMAGCRRIANGAIGGTLYDIEGRFPALVHYGSDPVSGEIWRCPGDLLLTLDAYEGTASGLFRRMAVEIETDEGEMLPCWIYTAGPSLSRHLTPANRIAAGRWEARSP